MKLTLATISESASVDVQTNQLSIFNVIEDVQVLGNLPAQYPRVTLVSVWEREDLTVSTAEEKINCKLTLKSGTASVPMGEFEVALAPAMLRKRVILNLMGLPLTSEGANRITFEAKNTDDGARWREVHTITFQVKVAEQDVAQ